MPVFPRISGQVGSPIDLNVTFYRNGVAADPFAIRRIDIYAQSVVEENLVAQVIIPEPDETGYPLPLTSSGPGEFNLEFDVPCDFEDGIVYLDVWRFIGIDCDVTGLDLDDEDVWQESCHRFYIFSDSCFVDDMLIIPRFDFEPLDFRVRKEEIRTIEVGIMPLPLYDFNYNQIMPIIPQFKPFIQVETEQCEIVVPWTAGKMGVRQGSYRANPWNAQFTFDFSGFLRGSYLYKVRVDLPNGERRVSKPFRFSVE